MFVVSMTANGIDHSDNVHRVSNWVSAVPNSNLTVSNLTNIF